MAALSEILTFRQPLRSRGRKSRVSRNVKGDTSRAIRASCQSRNSVTMIIAPRVSTEVMRGIMLSTPNERSAGASCNVR